MSIVDKVRSIQKSGKQPSILVIGDIMIDHYIWGGATRLSPEAPVPIVNVKRETTTLGGAGNLTQNLVSLGAKVMLGGVKGDDEAGKQLIEILSNEGVQSGTIITDINRPTTIKTRVLAGNQQIVRIDRELTDALTPELEYELLNKLIAHIDEADIVVLSDYNKGLFSPVFTQNIIKAANDRQKKVIVDPKGLNYEKYKGAFIIKPNKKELTEAAKAEKIKGIADVKEAAKAIFEQTNVTYLVVTLSEEGMAIVSKDDCKILPVKATEVFDVTGAGDTVLAAIAYFIASGLSVEEACDLANHAAAIVIRHIGSATTTIDEIIDDINNTR
ncbi:D-glycero-beta-D-manno-heptose-7-phosphate kinase [Mucilaginibacter sp. X5P1]|uniref:D-glycero-beta-D-manno-heptose-7-phosphate kinase n=1 Tax=Mucilaginibacter sp. X5P1 TaxID=2723088 RepID=UPI00160A55EE|nr:D-glycero-beta-D-manno-heptose-7-phosphate kinase [Mucilaginibacter sp. X5P1]MBB6138160.1 D-beta-D-heptose 7-phosphate kinase/D-beta-D-heptose 1-phosphate adenosyltransferase [Mucilaginibacter sp. X5P1]